MLLPPVNGWQRLAIVGPNDVSNTQTAFSNLYFTTNGSTQNKVKKKRTNLRKQNILFIIVYIYVLCQCTFW